MTKSILILKATKDICGSEIGLIEYNCKLLEMEVVVEEIKSENGLIEIVNKYETREKGFDYIYLCTHGNKEGFKVDLGERDINLSWHKFASLICENQIASEDSILLLACCRGGLSQVAADILAVCNKINFICGVKWSVRPWDLTTGFVVFIHNIENKLAEPSYAAQKASLATDYTFICYDRDEVEGTTHYENRQHRLYKELGWINDDFDILVKSNRKILENSGLLQYVENQVPSK